MARCAQQQQQAALRQQQTTTQQQQQAAAPPAAPTGVQPAPGPLSSVVAAPEGSSASGVPTTPAARIAVDGPRVRGALNLRGARLDDLVLKDYHETVDRSSPLVRLLAPRDGPAPYWAQWGWTAADGRTRVPGNDTVWQASGDRLAPGAPVTLTWDNGQGQVFEIALSLDENYMFTAEQRVRNTGAEPVQLLPWV